MNLSDAGIKAELLAKYRTTFVDRLTRRDLEELKSLLRNKFDPDRRINREYLDRFAFKMREYLHEEIITREMATLEALVEMLQPEDLRS
ncbi:MAG TPA: hypothetical protein VMT44_07895 [Methanoregula sp.]|nr:hypothetical protein [Methanoregula sp.]